MAPLAVIRAHRVAALAAEAQELVEAFSALADAFVAMREALRRSRMPLTHSVRKWGSVGGTSAAKPRRREGVDRPVRQRAFRRSRSRHHETKGSAEWGCKHDWRYVQLGASAT